MGIPVAFEANFFASSQTVRGIMQLSTMAIAMLTLPRWRTKQRALRSPGFILPRRRSVKPPLTKRESKEPVTSCT